MWPSAAELVVGGTTTGRNGSMLDAILPDADVYVFVGEREKKRECVCANWFLGYELMIYRGYGQSKMVGP